MWHSVSKHAHHKALGCVVMQNASGACQSDSSGIVWQWIVSFFPLFCNANQDAITLCISTTTLANFMCAHYWLMMKCLFSLAPNSVLEIGQAQDDQSILLYLETNLEINLCCSELAFGFWLAVFSGEGGSDRAAPAHLKHNKARNVSWCAEDTKKTCPMCYFDILFIIVVVFGSWLCTFERKDFAIKFSVLDELFLYRNWSVPNGPLH